MREEEKRSVKSTKNQSIELLRFLFTSIIIFFHINLDLWDQKKVIGNLFGFPVTFFEHGNLAVEFFFLVTGYTMAASIWKKTAGIDSNPLSTEGKSGERPPRGYLCRFSPQGGLPKTFSQTGLWTETLQFITRKAGAIMPYYLIACALTPPVRLMIGKKLPLSYFLERLPSLLFLQRMGLGRPVIGCTWYLSSMFIALALAYPLCRRFYRAYTHVLAPILCVLLLGAIIALTGSLGDIDDWFFITYKTNVRAFAEISMGSTAFEISRQIRGRVRSVYVRLLLTALSLLSLGGAIACMCSRADGRCGLLVFGLLLVLVVTAFSGEGLFCHADLFHSPLFRLAGEISLPMFVSQTLLRRSIPFLFPKSPQWTQCFLIYTGTLALGILLRALVTCVKTRTFLSPLRRRPLGQERAES